jgi:hypothetical protein
MHADRNSAAVVGNGDAVVRHDGDVNFIAEIGKRFIYAVIDNLPHEMIQSPRFGRPDIHAGPFPDRFQAFKHLNLTFVIRLIRLLFHRHISHLYLSSLPFFPLCRPDRSGYPGVSVSRRLFNVNVEKGDR